MKLTFRSPGIPAPERDIVALERHLCCSLPLDYRSFLLEASGGEQPDRNIFSIENGEETVLKELHSLKKGTPLELWGQINSRHEMGILQRDLIPIGLDAFGNDICLGITGKRIGEIYFRYHDRGKADPNDEFDPVYFVSHSFKSFVLSLKAKAKRVKDEIESIGEAGTRADLLNYLSQGNSLEKKNKDGRSLIQEAARYGNLKLLQACQEHGVDLKGTLRLAVMNSRSKIVDYLLSHGVEVNERDKEGRTPLFWVGPKNKDLADMLRKHGATK